MFDNDFFGEFKKLQYEADCLIALTFTGVSEGGRVTPRWDIIRLEMAVVVEREIQIVGEGVGNFPYEDIVIASGNTPEEAIQNVQKLRAKLREAEGMRPVE